MAIKMLEVKSGSPVLGQILGRAREDLGDALKTVIPIMEDVRLRGDSALRHFTKLFDKVELGEFAYPVSSFKVSPRNRYAWHLKRPVTI